MITHAIAPTLSDVRGTLFEGPAGFLATIPVECLYEQSVDKAYNKSLHELRLSNGSLIRGFGAQEEAGRLRGPQCHNLIADELREWEKPAGNLELAMTNALFGLRLVYPDGTPSRAVMGTTPKPIPFLKRFEKRAGVKVVRGSSYENIKNLAGVYRTQLLSLAGTQIGRQEIDGLYIDEESDHAILKRGWIRLWPKDPDTGKPRKLPEFSFILEVYDTAASEENWDKKKQVTDPSGSIVLGVFNVAQCFTEAERKKYRVRSKYACLLLDCWTERLGLPDLLERARAQHRTLWGPKGRGRRADMVLIENASSGPGLRQFMAKWGIPTWPYNPRIGKTMRVHGISPLVQQGMLWVPESGRPDRENLPIDWSEPFLEQICAFGGEGTTEHDEYVDCLLGSTGIYTKRGVVPIEQVVRGDEVLTHRGRWRLVTDVGSRLSDHFYRLKAKGLDEIGITGNHKVLTMQVAASQKVGKEARGVSWKRTDELAVRPTRQIKKNGKMTSCVRRVIHDTLLIPRCTGTRDVVDLSDYLSDGVCDVGPDWIVPSRGKRRKTPRYLRLDAEAGWVMGLYAAEGCYTSNGHIAWACDEGAIQRCAAWVRSNLHREGHIAQKARVFRLAVGCQAAVGLFSTFGRGAPNKVVPPWVLEAPEDFIQGFVDGYTDGDGHRFRGKSVTLTSASKGLLLGVRLLLARLGIVAWNGTSKPSGPRMVFSRISECLEAYTLTYTDRVTSWFGVVSSEYIGTHIEVLGRVDHPTTVFNLQVEEDESYLTVGGLVHNCISAGFAYLRDRAVLEATPEVQFLDLDEKLDQDKAEASEMADRERAREAVNPYGV